MLEATVKQALLALGGTELSGLARAADHILAGRPIFREGPIKIRFQAGHGMDFLDFQQYTPGGDVRAVDWRASARSRHYQIRRYREESSSEWFVCLDRSASMAAGDGSKWVLAVQLAAAFLYLLLRKTDRVGLLAFSEGVDLFCPSGRGRSQYARAVSVLARCQPQLYGGESRLDACAGRLGRRRSVVVISDFLKPDFMRSGLDRILALEGAMHAVQVLSPDECTVDFDGAGLIEDIESGARLTVEAGAGLSEAVAHRLDMLRHDLAGYCRRNGVPFTSCEAGQPWKSVMIEHLSGVRRGHA